MAQEPMDSVTDTFRQLFGDAHDHVLLLRSDRCLEAANPAFLEGVRLAKTPPTHQTLRAPLPPRTDSPI